MCGTGLQRLVVECAVILKNDRGYPELHADAETTGRYHSIFNHYPTKINTKEEKLSTDNMVDADSENGTVCRYGTHSSRYVDIQNKKID